MRTLRRHPDRLALAAACVSAALVAVPLAQDQPLSFSFSEVAEEAGLIHQTVYGGVDRNRFLLETTGPGVALLDVDADGWLDVFLVNGTSFERPAEPRPSAHLYRNLRNGRFEDVTDAMGLRQAGWGQGACVGDYDRDGRDDLHVAYWGQNRLFRNAGQRFEDVTEAAGLVTARRWGAGCAFLDVDRDGHLDLFVANYIDFDPDRTPTPDSGLCRYKGVPVACGPPGLAGGKYVLYRNTGRGTFEDVSDSSGVTRTASTYGLGVTTLDFNDDGWVDVYVASDSSPSALFVNNTDGTFTDMAVLAGCAYSKDGKPQAGMGVAVADLDRSGTIDLFKTNFAGDTSTLYLNDGKGYCDDRTFPAGIGINTRYLGWGVGAPDFDRDGWPDLFLVNGHVYPEVSQLPGEAAYAQRKVVYRNAAGRFEDVTERLGPPVTLARPGRGAAFGDLDNDGDVDIVVNNMHTRPDLYRVETRASAGTWLLLHLRGVASNPNAIGARVTAHAGTDRWVDEVRGGGSYYAQNDFRIHMGLGAHSRVERLEVRWPSGLKERWHDVAVNQLLTLREGSGRPVRE